MLSVISNDGNANQNEMKFHFSFTKITKTKILTPSNVEEVVVSLQFLHITDSSTNECESLENFGSFLFNIHQL